MVHAQMRATPLPIPIYQFPDSSTCIVCAVIIVVVWAMIMAIVGL
jgi:hypothetical protein